jgi:glycosyltransferase involved in cell wall biosynthesis
MIAPCCDEPLFSVILPTFGREELLLGCVDSIMTGEFQNFEILVIDQDPTQHLRESLCRRYPDEKRLRYLFLERAGASKARNHGINEAKGKYIAFIDDDAVAYKEWLQAYCETFEQIDPEPALIAGRIDPFWDGEKPSWYPQACEYILGLYNLGDAVCPMPEQDQPISANLAGLRAVIHEVGGFNETLGPNYFRKHAQITGEDSFLGLSVRRAGYSIYYAPLARVNHRISNNKLKKLKFLRRFFWEGVTVILKMHLNGTLGSRKNHLRYHSKYAAKMFILSIFPGLSRHRDTSQPVEAERMLHLSQVTFSLGVIYAVIRRDSLIRR